MTNFKLQYRETKWVEAETGIEIAPQDQEKVNKLLWCDYYINSGTSDPFSNYKIWQPEKGKLYDSGDLEFELKRECPSREFEWCEKCQGGDCTDEKQFWVLKEKAKEEIVTCLGCGKEYNPLNKEECNYHNLGECQPSEEAKEIHDCTKYAKIDCTCNPDECKHEETLHPSAYNLIKQLQSRIAEIEEQRERLIAELMNAEDKLKELDVSDQEQLINDLSDIANDYKNNDEYHYDREGFIKEIKSKFVVRIKESN